MGDAVGDSDDVATPNICLVCIVARHCAECLPIRELLFMLTKILLSI